MPAAAAVAPQVVAVVAVAAVVALADRMVKHPAMMLVEQVVDPKDGVVAGGVSSGRRSRRSLFLISLKHLGEILHMIRIRIRTQIQMLRAILERQIQTISRRIFQEEDADRVS